MTSAPTLEGFRLSPQQERLWAVGAAVGASAVAAGGDAAPLRSRCALRLAGRPAAAAVAAALRRLVERHELLRTTFPLLPGMRLPMMAIAEADEVAMPRLPLVDLGALPAAARRRAEAEIWRRLTPPAADAAPPVTARLVERGDGGRRLLLALPALAADRVSLRLLAAELAAALTVGPAGGADDEPMQYADVAEWQQGLLEAEETRAGGDPWRRLGASLDGAAADGALLDAAVLPDGKAAAPFAPRRAVLTLDAAASAALDGLAAGCAAPPAALVLAAWSAVLARHRDGRPPLLAVTCDGRAYEGLEDVLGPLSRALPLAPQGDALATPFDALARRLDAAWRQARERQEYFTWETFLGGEADDRRAPYLAYAFEDATVEEASRAASDGGNGVTLTAADVVADRFELRLVLAGAPSAYRLEIAWDAGRLSEAAALERLAEVRDLLAAAAVAPQAATGALDAFDTAAAPRRHRLLVEANDTALALPQEQLLHQLFEAQARRTADAVAVSCDGAALTYGELERRAEALAARLCAAGVGPEVRVGLCTERSLDMVVGLFAVLKAGGAYVPLDPEYPAERLAFMVEDAAAPVILTQGHLLDRLPETAARVLLVEDESGAGGNEAAPRRQPSPDAAAYLIYTSGSTGKPKGAVIPHRAIVAHMHWMQHRFPLAAGDAVVHKTPFSFDASVWEFHAPLMVGGRLVVARPGGHREPAYLLALCAEERVSVLQVVPTLLRVLLAEPAFAADLPLRRVFCGGEALTADLVEGFAALSPAQLVNVYGPAEATIHAACWPAPRRRSATAAPAGVAIGRPISNVRLYVVDAAGRAVAPGVAGELWVGGAGLGRGYLGRPGLTAERFVPDPFPAASGAAAGRRLYRTGDLVRRRPDGELDFLGRVDHQVKVRGFRVELGEIEAALRALPQVADAAVLLRRDEPGEPRLVAYLTAADGEPSAVELAARLGGELPDYMLPTAWVVLDELPLSPSGKVDRRALAALAPPEAAAGDRAVAAPRTPVEELLAEIWAEVLHLDRVGADEAFFDLGGHSLLATQVIARVREVFQVELPVRTLFEAPTVAELARRVETARRDAARAGGDALPAPPPLAPRPDGGEAPLSFAQSRLWFLHRMEPESSFYNAPGALRLRGDLDVAALGRALGEVVRRHQVLRTAFTTVDGRPLPVVLAAEPFAVPLLDLSALAAGARQERARELAVAEARTPFDLSAAPQLRALVLRLGDDDHVAVFTLHHIVSDEWSLGVLVREVAALYAFYRDAADRAGGSSPLPDLTIQYADFAAWQRGWLEGEVLESQLDWWRRHLDGAPPVLELPTDRPRPRSQTFRGAHLRFVLDDELTAGLRELGRRRGATPFMVLLAAFTALLSRLSGQDDVVVGTPVAGRTHRELEPLIGFFANTLALRTDLRADEDGEPSFADLLARVRQASLGAFAHQDLPFERLVDELAPQRDLAHTPLFQVMFTVQNPGRDGVELPGLEAESYVVESGSAKFDLTLAVTAGERFHGLLEYNRDLFEAATAQRIVDGLAGLAAAVVAEPERPLSALPLLAAEERRRLLASGCAAAPPALRPVLAEIAARAEEAPAAPALELAGETVSYGELMRRAGSLAGWLARRGFGVESRLALIAERRPETVAAILGALAAGAAWVPLDPAWPADRLGYMLADCGAEALLVPPGARLDAWPVPAGVPVLELGADAFSGPPAAPRQVPGEATAYVVYTSGSTGWPKGVSVPRRALDVRTAAMVQRYGMVTGDRTLHFISLSFDASLEEVFPTLAAGATLVFHPDPAGTDAATLLDWIGDVGITVLHAPAAAWQQMLAHLESGGRAPASLRCFITGGESWPVRRLLAWRRACTSEQRFFNAYGPTEATVTALVEEAPVDAAEIATLARLPVGRPMDGTRAYVVDRRGELVAAGVPGELWLGGEALARGYLGRPAATAERFVPDPFATPASAAAGDRVYRTGDRVRWRPDHRLEFLGRLDEQLKVRGVRLEPAEVEAAFLAQPGIGQAAAVLHVAAAADGAKVERLVVFYVASAAAAGDGGMESATAESDEAALLRAVAERLPRPAVPQRAVALDALPRTPGGKLDRRALARRSLPAEPAAGGAAAAGPLEQMLAGLWRDLLGANEVYRGSSFFALGGHSLLATRLVSRLRDAAGVELPLKAVFEAPTLEDMARRVGRLLAGSAAAAPPLVPLAQQRRRAGVPLSFAQQRLWFLDRLEPGSALYNVPAAWRLRGALSVAALGRALDEIVRRHEVLRTVFAEGAEDGNATDGSETGGSETGGGEAGGEPVQVVLPPRPVPLPLTDLAALPPRRREARLRQLVAAEARRPFDLERGPLLRAQLVHLADDDHALLLTLHHVAADGWSMGVLAAELGSLYAAYRDDPAASSPLPDLALQYGDFAVWQRDWLSGDALEAQLAWWRRALAAAPPALELPTDRPRPAVPSYRGGRAEMHLSADLAARLEALGRRRGATLFMVLLAAYQSLLARLAGQPRVVVGSDVANRTRGELERLVGFFVNQLALPADLSDDPVFEDLLDRVRETALGAYAHQDLPFELLVDELAPRRDLSRNPLFQAAFAYQEGVVEAAAPPARLPGLELEPVGASLDVAKFDLSLNLARRADGALAGSLEYARDLFDASTAETMVRRLVRLLEAVAEEPRRKVSALPLLLAAEEAQLAAWNDTAAPFPHARSFYELFAEQAARRPAAVAARCGDAALTYQELERRAETWARRLAAAGAGPEVVVALHLERGLDLLTALLAVFRCGAAYLPLETAYPAARLAELLHDGGARLVLAGAAGTDTLDEALAQLAGRGQRVPRLAVAEVEGSEDGAAATAAPPPAAAGGPDAGGPDALAYVLYTSGSTGKPKGAMVTRRGMVNHLYAKITDLALDAGDAVAQTASPCFDISVWQYLAALLVGGRVEVLEDAVAHDALALARAVGELRVTVLEVVPSLLREMLQDDEAASQLAGLRWMVATGEALPPELARRWRGRFPGVPLLNAYGPTECSDDVTHEVVAEVPEGGPVAIGRAVGNLALHVLDRRLGPLPPGVVGELWVGGVGVGRGYLGDPARTAAVFLPDPFAAVSGQRLYRSGDRGRRLADGRLEFLGRVDQQVKIRGHRVEPGEIEAALERHPAVAAVAVLARRDGPGGPRLVAYLTADSEPSAAEPSAAELAAFLAERLPEHMVPAAFELLATLPLTANGKVDRRVLAARPAPDFAPRGGGAAPRTPLEELLAGLFADVLETDAVGADDDFFALGGHSLLATRLASRVRRACGVELPLRDVFEAPTPAALAERVEAALSAGRKPAPPVEATPRDGDLPLSFAQQRLWFLHRMDPASSLYNVPAALRLRGSLASAALQHTLDEVRRRHEVLRSVFPDRDGRPVQVVRPAAPRPLPVVDLSGLAAGAGEAEAKQLAAAEAARPFDLATDAMLRGRLLRLSGADHAVLATVHHIASDGWSLDLLRGEVAALYAAYAAGAPSPLAELPVQYGDFARWQRSWVDGGELDAQVEWWRRRLDGAPELLELPADHPRPTVQSFRGGHANAVLPADLTADLRALARRRGVTLYMLLLAGFQVLLYRHSGQRDVVVGSPVAGRNRAETEGLIGFFVNNLVLRTDLSGDPTFGELLARVRETALGAYSHQDVPFDRLVDELVPQRSLRHSPLFQAVVALEDATGERPFTLPGLAVEPFEPPGGSTKFDLSLLMSERPDVITETVEYNADLFAAATVGRLLVHYETLLREIAADPQRRLSELRLLSLEETAGYSPQDFPEAELSQQELENLMRELEAPEAG